MKRNILGGLAAIMMSSAPSQAHVNSSELFDGRYGFETDTSRKDYEFRDSSYEFERKNGDTKVKFEGGLLAPITLPNIDEMKGNEKIVDIFICSKEMGESFFKLYSFEIVTMINVLHNPLKYIHNDLDALLEPADNIMIEPIFKVPECLEDIFEKYRSFLEEQKQ